MESNKVLVMKDGDKAEYDHPGKLLDNEAGVFTSMVAQVRFLTCSPFASGFW